MKPPDFAEASIFLASEVIELPEPVVTLAAIALTASNQLPDCCPLTAGSS